MDMQFELGNSTSNDHLKDPIYRSTSKGHYYAIIRVGKSYKNLGQITGFEKHMERLQDTPNANPNIPNEIIIGGQNLADRVKEYISDARYMTNNTVIARELLITASPDFFRGIPESELKLWVQQNIKFLKDRYGSNIIYVTLHRDEKTPHLHVLLSPKVWSEKRKCFVMSSRKLFGDKFKLRNLQTEYANHISSTFKSLHRGIFNSKAKHIEIRHFYGILKNVRSRENVDEILKNDILLQHKIKGLNATLEAYRSMLSDKDKNIEELNKLTMELKKQVKDLKKDRDLYKSVIKQLSQTYKLPQNAVEKTIKYIKNELEIKK